MSSWTVRSPLKYLYSSCHRCFASDADYHSIIFCHSIMLTKSLIIDVPVSASAVLVTLVAISSNAVSKLTLSQKHKRSNEIISPFSKSDKHFSKFSDNAGQSFSPYRVIHELMSKTQDQHPILSFIEAYAHKSYITLITEFELMSDYLF